MILIGDRTYLLQEIKGNVNKDEMSEIHFGYSEQYLPVDYYVDGLPICTTDSTLLLPL